MIKMSDKPTDNPGEEQVSSQSRTERKVIVDVKDTTRVKELREELDELRAQLREKEGLEDNYEEKLKVAQDKHDDLQAQLESIALRKFEEEKKAILTMANATLLDEDGKPDKDKIKEIEERIQRPEDLASTKYFLELLQTSIKTAQKPSDEPPEIPGKPTATVPTPGTPQNPPMGTTVSSIPPEGAKIFTDYKDMTDDLYSRMARGDKEAERQVNQLWEKAVQLLRKNRGMRWSATECPLCGAGISATDDECPYCGWKRTPFEDRVI